VQDSSYARSSSLGGSLLRGHRERQFPQAGAQPNPEPEPYPSPLPTTQQLGDAAHHQSWRVSTAEPSWVHDHVRAVCEAG